MSRPQRLAQYIQQLAYASLIHHDESDVRPEDAPRAPDPTPNFAAWNATSFSTYEPFRNPLVG